MFTATRMKTFTDELNKLYREIRACHICPEMDLEKALRLTQAVNPKSDVFIISQSLAAKQLRRSGVNFFEVSGKLGNTGNRLERFLNKFNRTVYPYQEVIISNNVTIPKCRPDHLSVYNTEIAQCYPGKEEAGHGDRTPEKEEIHNCIKQGFLIKEIEMIEPRLLLLMGKSSRDSFFKHILNAPYPDSLSTHISEIVQTGEIPQFYLGNRSVYIFPIQHASGANPQFRKIITNAKLIELIKEVLE